MPELIFKIAELFEIQGRGLVVATDRRIRDIPFVLHQGEAIEFRDQAGGVLRSTIRAFEFATPFNPNRTFAFLVGEGVSKADIHIGTEIWLVSPHPPIGAN